jgi:cytochrome P450
MHPGLHLGSHNWDHPHEFLPERWDQPGAEYWPGDLCPHGQAGAQAAAAGDSSAGAAAEGSGRNSPALLATATEEEGAEPGGSEAWTLVESERPPLRFAPFSQGPRSCIGQVRVGQRGTAFVLFVLLPA